MISIKDIKEMINEVTFSLRDLCNSVNINKWSLFKPVNSDSRVPLTDDDYKEINFGYENYTSLTGPNLARRNILWEYTPRTAPYRLSDFSNYDNYSKFIDFINNGTTEIYLNGWIRCSFTGDIKYIVNNFKAFEDARTSSTSIYLCILMMASTENEEIVNYVYRVCEVNEYDYNDIRFNIGNNVALGKYTIVPVLMNNPQVNNMQNGDFHVFQNQTGQCWLLPKYCEYNIEVIDNGSEYYFDDVYFELSNVYFDYDAYMLSNFEVTSTIVNTSNRTYTISMNVDYSNTTEGNVTLGNHSCTLTSTDTTSTTRITDSNTHETVTDAQLYDGIITVTVNATIRYGTDTQHKNWSVRLES